MASEGWTRDLAVLECQSRRWILKPTQWTERLPRERFPRNRDLFGFVDGLAAPEAGEPASIAIQWTAVGDMARRVRKIQESPNLEFVRRLGWTILVWGFNPKTGELREVELT